ncbi:MAG TPA: DUF4199 domain-containing protein [Lunatimonas sp.]|nr:DUF4199 domain-containing protein [Lunatimonas sp.]
METSPIAYGAKVGVYIGLIMVIITLLLYFVDYTLLVSMWFGIIALILFFGLILYAGFNFRKANGGFLAFGPAFQFAFVTLIVVGVISMLGNILLYQVIDPQLPELLVESQLESMLSMMDRFGAGDSITGDQIDEMRGGLEVNYTLAGQMKSFGIGLIIYAVLGLIIAAIIKKKDTTLDY